MDTLKSFWRLFAAFFKIGIMTFGGGYAMLPMLEREIVEKHGWTTREELLDYFAIGQCTPGIIAVNTATFIGYKLKKIPGGVVATVGVITPSVIIISVIAALLSGFGDNVWVTKAFVGIRVAVGALITSSVIKLVKSSVKNVLHILLAVAAFVVVAVFGQNPVWAVLAAAVFGLCVPACGTMTWKKKAGQGKPDGTAGTEAERSEEGQNDA